MERMLKAEPVGFLMLNPSSSLLMFSERGHLGMIFRKDYTEWCNQQRRVLHSSFCNFFFSK